MLRNNLSVLSRLALIVCVSAMAVCLLNVYLHVRNSDVFGSILFSFLGAVNTQSYIVTIRNMKKHKL